MKRLRLFLRLTGAALLGLAPWTEAPAQQPSPKPKGEPATRAAAVVPDSTQVLWPRPSVRLNYEISPSAPGLKTACLSRVAAEDRSPRREPWGHECQLRS